MNRYLFYFLLLISIVALFVACFAITGYIRFRDQSIPPSAEKTKNTTIVLNDGQRIYTVVLPLDDDEFVVKLHFNHSMNENDIESIEVDGHVIPNSNMKVSGSDNRIVSFDIPSQTLGPSITVTVTLVEPYTSSSLKSKGLSQVMSPRNITVNASTRKVSKVEQTSYKRCIWNNFGENSGGNISLFFCVDTNSKCSSIKTGAQNYLYDYVESKIIKTYSSVPDCEKGAKSVSVGNWSTNMFNVLVPRLPSNISNIPNSGCFADGNAVMSFFGKYNGTIFGTAGCVKNAGYCLPDSLC